jgi:hypothetical protein
MKNKFYVYQHLVKGKVVYVGQGSGRRAWDNKNVAVEILKENMTRQEARDLEHYYINGYLRLGYKLTNIMLGKKHSPETRLKSSLSHMGQSRPFTPEHRAALSKALTGKKLTEEHRRNVSLGGIGKHVDTEATRLKRIASHKGKQPGWYGTDQQKDVANKISATLKSRNFENRFEKIIERQMASH